MKSECETSDKFDHLMSTYEPNTKSWTKIGSKKALNVGQKIFNNSTT